MINFVFKYVKICQHCKRIKIYRHVKHDFLKFLFIFERYFQKIIVNFIIFLFVCKRNDKNYRHIMIMIDRLSKIKRFVILKFLNVDVVMQTFIDWIWRIKDFSNTIIFDRNTQYTTNFWKRLNERVNNHLKHFTSFYFETNDQIEIINNDFKKYFKIYCNYQQNDWYDWLSFVEFEINFVSSNFTTIISFLIIKNYISRSKLKFANFIEKISNAQRQMKTVDEFVKKMIDFQKFLRAELIWAQTK